MGTGERIKYLREKSGMSQGELADKIGVTRATIAKYENGFSSPKRTIEKLTSIFNVTTDYILCKTDIPYPNIKANRIPVLEKFSEGISFEEIQCVENHEEIPATWGNPSEYFAFHMQGHSMEPRIWDGDIVIAHKQNDVDSGEIAVVLIGNSNVTVKQITKINEGLMLSDFNTSVSTPRFYTSKEVHDLLIRIIGRIKEVRWKL